MPDFIVPRVTIDQEEIFQRYVAEMQARRPGWTPNDAEPDTWIGEAMSFMAAELGEQLTEQLTSDFRWFLANMAGVPPVDASYASGLATVVLTDTLGHTIAAGDLVVAFDTGGTLVGFQNDADIVVTAGSSTATGVSFTARDPGADADGLTGLAQQVAAFSFVGTVTFTTTTSGGADAEEDDDYLDRGRAKLQVSTDTPILARDFAILARDIAGVARAVAVDGFDATDNEVQSITGTATGGTGTLTFNGQTTSALAFNASAAAVQAALEALSNIEPGDVVVTGGPLGTGALSIEFRGQYLNTNVAQITATTGSLTGGTWTTATTRTITSAYDPATIATWAKGAVTVAGLDSAGADISDAEKTAVDNYLQSLRETGFKVSVIAAIRTAVGATFDFTTWPGFDPVDVKAAAEQAVIDYLSPSNWGRPPFDEPSEWLNNKTVRQSEIYGVLNAVDGLNYAANIVLSGGTASGSDRILPGVIAVPTPGTITGTAV